MPGSINVPDGGTNHLKPVTVHAKREGLITVARYCPERPYVELQVPKNIHTIKTVIFRTSSHDQGWSDQEERFAGTYIGTFTWFQAVVLSPIGHDRVRRRVIQYNVRARFDFRKHEIRWDHKDDDDSIKSWLAAIEGGDTIQIIPKADYLAWINYVREAEIEIYGLESSLKSSTFPAMMDKFVLSDMPESAPANFYRPLNQDDREMRLICLNSGPFDEPISCSMKYGLAARRRSYQI